MSQNIIDKLNQKKKERDMVWRPKEGERLIGKVVFAGSIQAHYGEQKYLLVQTETEDKKVFVSAGLERQLSQQKVKKGDFIGIEYFGEVGRGKKKAKGYALVVDENARGGEETREA